MFGKRFDDRMKFNESEVFKIQTQIRVELNNLRKTYQDALNVTKKQVERKHFPQQLYKETLKAPEPEVGGITDRSRSESKTPDRGRRRIVPVHLQDRRSVSPMQRRHYPGKYNDNINLEIKRSRHPSAYLAKRQNSQTEDKTGERRANSILSFVDNRQKSIERPSKKIIPGKHVFTKQFF